ncbi:MAG: M23 family metallopeptidase [Bacteroidota bacterium]|nr:M23 family metallopeptidase [Bacteroidota bacterium]
MRVRLLLLLALLLTGCGEQLENLRERYRPDSPRDAYVHALQTTGIDQSRIAQLWLAEGAAVLEVPVEPTLPYVEEGRLITTDIMALGYRLSLTRGQQLIVEADTQDGFLIFADLYEPMDEQGLPLRRVTSADSTGYLEWDVRRTKDYLLRIQPEILSEGAYRLSIRTDASLVFPVSGHTSSSVQSFFGDVRDGGRRDHHGVDIFAPRGTPVVAVREGTVRSVRTTGRGGKQVWLRDVAGHNYYYAHLEEQLVREQQKVVPGDTLGLVGNSGNAISTPPHLHFGIYQRGPHDPWPYVHSPSTRPSRVAVDRDRFGQWRSVYGPGISIRSAPTRRAETQYELADATSLHIIGGTANWYHVRLDNGQSGYVPSSQLDMTLTADRPQRRLAAASLGG